MSTGESPFRFDLESLADGYRHRPPSPTALERARRAASNALDPLLDIGGGRGHHAAEWARLGRRSLVIDRSTKMTRSAALRDHVTVVKGSAEDLPFHDGSVGLAYFHLSIHYGAWERSVAEADRVVRRTGNIVIWTFDPGSIADSSLARWFPSIVAIDTPRFPDPHDIADHLSGGGRPVVISTEVEHIERRAGDWIDAVRAGFVSSLQAVPPEELETGLRAFRAQYPSDDDMYRYTIPYVTIASVAAPLR